MFSSAAEKTISRLILIGAPFATLFLLTDTVTDPVNAPKLLIAGGLGAGLFLVFLFFDLKEKFAHYKIFILLIVLFNLALINAVIQSKAPVAQQVFGVYGRNTGLVTYIILSFIAVGALTLKSKSGFSSIIKGLQIAGIVNVVYCLWVLVFGDFIKWNNPYGNILGLFGNPDFISAFLGIFIASLAVYVCTPQLRVLNRLGGIVIAVITFYEIVRSHAIQGIAVTVAGLGIVFFYVLRDRFKSKLIPISYLGLSIVIGIVAVLGALQTGPLKFIYKRSVSLRGIYWDTAINMGKSHPFSGVGLDSYGDWYRAARPLKALTDPGINTTSNAAHNVILDFFANGGWPLLLGYLAILVAGFISIVRVTVRQKKFDPIFVSLAAVWLTYQLQSIISINQIGLAIWGWLPTGALIAYERFSRSTEDVLVSAKSERQARIVKKSSGVISPQLVAGIGIVVGAFFVSPPIAADSKWFGALQSNNANQVLAALEPSFFNPSDSQRFAQAIQLFASSNLLDQAHQIALDSVKFNPDNYQSWKSLYFLENSTQEEKVLAARNLKRLDPHNPDVTKP